MTHDRLPYRSRRMPVIAGLVSGLVLLSACGGGDSAPAETPAPAAPAGYPVEAVMTTLYTTNNQVLSTGFVDPANSDNFYFTTSIKQDGSADFEGQARQVAEVQTIQRRNGVVTSVGTSRTYYATAPLAIHGQVDDEGRYSSHQQVSTLPLSAQPGESGTWYTATEYADATKAEVRQTKEVRWVVNGSGEADTAWVCLNIITKETAKPDMTHASSSCIKVDHDGQFIGVALSAGGSAL